jgi:hypothetical protein
VLYRFNCHQNKDFKSSNISFKKDANSLPDFRIDFVKSEVIYCKEEKKQDNRLVYDYYPALIYKIGLYRMPEPILGTLFLPMIIMTLMQIFVFFAKGAQIMKLACVLLIYLAIISFLQVFRASIPVYPVTSLGDKIIYASLLMTIFTAVDSFLDMGNSESSFF